MRLSAIPYINPNKNRIYTPKFTDDELLAGVLGCTQVYDSFWRFIQAAAAEIGCSGITIYRRLINVEPHWEQMIRQHHRELLERVIEERVIDAPIVTSGNPYVSAGGYVAPKNVSKYFDWEHERRNKPKEHYSVYSVISERTPSKWR